MIMSGARLFLALLGDLSVSSANEELWTPGSEIKLGGFGLGVLILRGFRLKVISCLKPYRKRTPFQDLCMSESRDKEPEAEGVLG